MMKLWVVAAAVCAWSTVAWAADGDQWYDGEIVFKTGGNLTEFKTEKEACTASAAALTKMGNKQTYSSFKAGTDDHSVTCILKDSDGKTWDQVNNVTKVIKCKDNTYAVSTDNSGTFKSQKCRCDPATGCPTAPPHPPVQYGCPTPPDNPVCLGKSYPPLDTSDRCTQQPASATSLKSANRHSKANKDAVAKHDPKTLSQYNEELKEMKKAIKGGEDINFPKFTDLDMCETGGPVDVNIGMPCGTREADFAAANNIAGLGGTPTYDGKDGRLDIPNLDCVWHHHEELGRMQLVKKSAHGAESHEGGVSIWKKAMGVTDYPLCCPPKKP